MATLQETYQAFDFFTYEVDFLAVTPGSSPTGQFTVQQEADFVLTKINMFADIAGGAQTFDTRVIPLATIVINDTGSGRNLMNTAIPLANIFGGGGLPFILPRQRIFVASSVVNITLSNFSAASTYNIRLSFIGEKAFKFGGQR